MIYYQISSSEGKLLAGNIHSFPRFEEFKNCRNFSEHQKGKGVKGAEENLGSYSVWLVAEDEKDLLQSGKLFKKTLEIYKNIAHDIWTYHKLQINAYAHVLNTIQGQMRQKIEGFAEESDFIAPTYSESVQQIQKVIESDIGSAADLICYLQKRVVDMRAHLLGSEVVHAGERYEVKPIKVSLRRAILSQGTAFADLLAEARITPRFFFEEECVVEIDKNMFSLVMYNFFSNIVKYCKFESEVRFNYSSTDQVLDVSMISLKMDQDEIGCLFKEGERGRHAAHLPGKGIGLFVIQKALNIMQKKSMYIAPDYSKNLSDDNGRVYIENHFKFFL